MSYIFKQSDLFDMVSALGFETHTKGNELWFKYCPYCNGGDKKDKDTFSVNLNSGAFKCFRASCAKEGHFVELARDLNYKLDMGDTKKQYRKLPQRNISVTDYAKAYLKSRGIGEDIAVKYKITTRNDNRNLLVFPFYDENGILQFIKYRNTKYNGSGNKEWCEKDTRPILFGMRQCVDFDRVIITEGQLDSLSVAESGINNAVSVPTGAMGFTWLQFCYEWLSKFKKVIVFGDNENGAMTLLDTLKAKLTQPVYSVRIADYLGEKDANDILRKYGKGAIRQCIEGAEISAVESVKDLADVKPVNIAELPKIKTGLPTLDKAIGGFAMGQVVLLTGRRGEGKSTFMSQLIAEALEQGKNVFAYSGELPDYHFQYWLDKQLAGADYLDERKNEYGDSDYIIQPAALERIHNWYRGRAYIYDNAYIPKEKSEYISLLDTIELVIRQYNVEFICIDNLMTAISSNGNKDNFYLAQSDFVGSLKKIAQRFNVVVLLVAHPRKSSGELGNDDVSGSADITNRVDIVLSYERADEQDNRKSLLSVTKNRLTGKLKTGDNRIELFFSDKTKRISDLKSTYRRYSWENEPDKYGDLLF
ncbi:MAG: AAA family ATPase [Acutalibacteraceae bacterium]|nr:AAA family ATPase [Acutalibacteraceae bacterium]